MTPYVITIGSGYDLLPDSTKPSINRINAELSQMKSQESRLKCIYSRNAFISISTLVSVSYFCIGSHSCQGQKWVNSLFFNSYAHYCDVIMDVMVSEITSLTIVYSTIHSGTDQRKDQSSASLAFVRGIHRWPVNSPTQMASNAENVFIWWRHHGLHSIDNTISLSSCIILNHSF